MRDLSFPAGEKIFENGIADELFYLFFPVPTLED